ncbi:MAG: hypothetical protein EZS28_010740 [Streblomastix strix]|uniref:Uncharacterized protein n=1 Tax=Streblomastix strix TaxID=222440 RepID=A0A5J4WFI1_9EUKA|nr:MAG: hypothetical protein EZS28_010740 [Streblomastix strix]
MEKDLGYESVKQVDCRLPLQDARFERGKTNNQTWKLEHFTRHLRCTSPPSSPNRIITVPSIRIPEQLLHIQSNAIQNQILTDRLRNCNRTYNATNLNENLDFNNRLRRFHPSPSPVQKISENMIQKIISSLKYFGFTINTAVSEIEPKQTVICLGLQLNLANATVGTKKKKGKLLLHDLYNMRRWIKTGTEITAKQIAK